MWFKKPKVNCVNRKSLYFATGAEITQLQNGERVSIVSSEWFDHTHEVIMECVACDPGKTNFFFGGYCFTIHVNYWLMYNFNGQLYRVYGFRIVNPSSAWVPYMEKKKHHIKNWDKIIKKLYFPKSFRIWISYTRKFPWYGGIRFILYFSTYFRFFVKKLDVKKEVNPVVDVFLPLWRFWEKHFFWS